MFKIPRVIISWSSSYQIQEEGIRGGGVGVRQRESRGRGVFLPGKAQNCQKNLPFVLGNTWWESSDLPFLKYLLKSVSNWESFLCLFQRYVYFLQLRTAFLKDPQAIPLKGDLEEGRACLPGSVEDRGLTSTPATGGHSSRVFCTDPPLIVSLPWLHWRPSHPPLLCSAFNLPHIAVQIWMEFSTFSHSQ